MNPLHMLIIKRKLLNRLVRQNYLNKMQSPTVNFLHDELKALKENLESEIECENVINRPIKNYINILL